MDPVLLKVIVGYADGATKEYQTSAPGVPEQVLETTGLELVALDKVPLTVVQAVPAVSEMAYVQRSFDGGPESVIVKALLAGFVVGSLVT